MDFNGAARLRPRAWNAERGGGSLPRSISLSLSLTLSAAAGRGGAQSGAVTAQADVYGLGGTLLFLFGGRRPYEGMAMQHIMHQVLM